MNKEVEIKVRVQNLESIKTILQNIGTFVKEVHQKDTYFSPSHRDFFARIPAEEFLRIREEGEKNEIAFHKVIDEGKDTEHSEEYEVRIDRVDRMRHIFDSLNLFEKFIVEKHREYWECGNFEVVLDDVTKLGSFIEVEVINSDKTSNLTKQDCFNFLQENNIPFTENITTSYPELFLKQ